MKIDTVTVSQSQRDGGLGLDQGSDLPYHLLCIHWYEMIHPLSSTSATEGDEGDRRRGIQQGLTSAAENNESESARRWEGEKDVVEAM